MVNEGPTDSLPVSMTGRGLRGRRMARLMFVIAIVPAAMLGAVFVSPPAMIGPLQAGEPGPLPGAAIIGAGILAYIVGLAWMIRIYRADPEAHGSFWRSRRY
jgi:hypothetical protein